MEKIMGNGNPRDTSVLIILSILIMPIVIGYLWVFIKNWLDNTNGLNTDDKYLNKYIYINKYNEGNDKKTEIYHKRVKQVDRERPPNASFFCRVNGKETFIEGPYEERFLDRYETIKWKYKKRQRELRKKIH